MNEFIRAHDKKIRQCELFDDKTFLIVSEIIHNLFTFSEKLNGQMFEEVISTVRKLCEAVSSDLETEMLEVSKKFENSARQFQVN